MKTGMPGMSIHYWYSSY